MAAILGYLVIVLLLGALVLLHELGHLLAARGVGIPVAQFSVGFGPAVWRRRWRGTEWCLRIVPLGGYVVPSLEEEEFRSVPLGRQLTFFLGGPVANLLGAVGLACALQLAREGWSLSLLWQPIVETFRFTWAVLGSLSTLADHPETVSGPIGIIAQGSGYVVAGAGVELALALSVSLAILNLLPVPILDGGQIVLAGLEAAFPRVERLRPALTVVGLVLVGGLMLFATWQDLARLLT